MQEEIGTGGGGFRFIYGAFLQQAHAISHLMMNCWKFQTVLPKPAICGAMLLCRLPGIYKGSIGSQEDFNMMGDYMIEIAELEKKAFTDLSKIKWS